MPRVGVGPPNDYGPRIVEPVGPTTVGENAAVGTDKSKYPDVAPVKKPSRCRQFIRHLRKRTKWTSALKMQSTVIRNAAGSVVCAWLVTACYSLGNIFSGKPSRDQSRRELIAANSAWASVAFSTVVVLAQLPLLLSFRFIDVPDRRPALSFCLKKLFRVAAFYFFVMFAIMVGWGTFVGYLTSIKPTLFKYKLDGHVNTLCTHGFFAGITLETKKIYYKETCQGREQLTKTSRQQPRPCTGPRCSPAPGTIRAPSRKQSFSYWRTYIKEFPKSIPAAVTGSFVQILSQQRIMDRSGSTIASFIIASVLLKLSIQTLIKHQILKKRIRSVRVMCAAVSLPTLLIDTQTRIILLGTQSPQFFTVGTLALAIVEISLRTGKAHYVMWVIRSRQANLPGRRKSTSPSLQQGSPKTMDASSPSPATLEFELWSSRFLAYHVAEINADTYAEYIAVGCSAAILVFFGDHPHYGLLRKLDSSDDLRPNQLKMLVFQIAVEVVVDFVATALEMMAGIEFGVNKSVGAFLTAFLAAIAVLNIIISLGIYLF